MFHLLLDILFQKSLPLHFLRYPLGCSADGREPLPWLSSSRGVELLEQQRKLHRSYLEHVSRGSWAGSNGLSARRARKEEERVYALEEEEESWGDELRSERREEEEEGEEQEGSEKQEKGGYEGVTRKDLEQKAMSLFLPLYNCLAGDEDVFGSGYLRIRRMALRLLGQLLLLVEEAAASEWVLNVYLRAYAIGWTESDSLAHAWIVQGMAAAAAAAGPVLAARHAATLLKVLKDAILSEQACVRQAAYVAVRICLEGRRKTSDSLRNILQPLLPLIAGHLPPRLCLLPARWSLAGLAGSVASSSSLGVRTQHTLAFPSKQQRLAWTLAESLILLGPLPSATRKQLLSDVMQAAVAVACSLESPAPLVRTICNIVQRLMMAGLLDNDLLKLVDAIAAFKCPNVKLRLLLLPVVVTRTMAGSPRAIDDLLLRTRSSCPVELRVLHRVLPSLLRTCLPRAEVERRLLEEMLSEVERKEFCRLHALLQLACLITSSLPLELKEDGSRREEQEDLGDLKVIMQLLRLACEEDSNASLGAGRGQQEAGEGGGGGGGGGSSRYMQSPALLALMAAVAGVSGEEGPRRKLLVLKNSLLSSQWLEEKVCDSLLVAHGASFFSSQRIPAHAVADMLNLVMRTSLSPLKVCTRSSSPAPRPPPPCVCLQA